MYSKIIFYIIFVITSFNIHLVGRENELPTVSPEERSPIDSIFHKPLSKGLKLIFQDRYKEGLVLFDSLRQIYPEHPAPYFYKAATYQNWMSGYRFNKFQKELEENIKLAINKGNSLIQKQPKNPWLNFYVGAAYGYRAFYHLRKYNWISAYIDGEKGITNFQQALKKEPHLYDTYLGLGSYHYWRTARSKFIRLIVFWLADKRKLGLEQIEFSINHGRYSCQEASFALVNALYDSKQYKRALEKLERYEAETDSTIIASLYLRGYLMTKLKNWSEVKKNFTQILQNLKDSPYQSIGYQVECKYWIAKALTVENQPQSAIELLESALIQAQKRKKETELEGSLEKYSDIKKKAQILLQKLKQS